MFGLFYTAMNLGIFIMSPFWGNLGDVIKRKYIVFIGLAGYGIAQGFFAYFSNEYLILIARFFAGFFLRSDYHIAACLSPRRQRL